MAEIGAGTAVAVETTGTIAVAEGLSFGATFAIGAGVIIGAIAVGYTIYYIYKKFNT
jgi:hypothetical protein